MELKEYKLILLQITLLIMFIIIDITKGGYQRQNKNNYNSISGPTTSNPFGSLVNPKWNEPYFDTTIPTNVTALVGKSAYLSCRVKNLGNKTVSWIRHRDIHILTVVTYTFTNDQRFQTTHHKDTDEWTLHIKWAQQRDAGMYECQVSTQPVKSYSVYLHIVDTNVNDLNLFYGSSYRPLMNDDHNVRPYLNSYQQDSDIYGRMYSDKFYGVPTTTILGGPELFVDKGSNINLTCIAKFSPDQIPSMFWYHENRIISQESSRGGITIYPNPLDSTISYLIISKADIGDSGKYKCDPSIAPTATVKVHVLNGERPEAMQTGTASNRRNFQILYLIILVQIFMQLSETNLNFRQR